MAGAHTITQRHELRNVLSITLKQAESSVRSLSVPGMHHSLSGALQVLESAGLQKADIQIFNDLLDRTIDFRLSILKISAVTSKNIPEPLQRDLQHFASEVQKIVEPCLHSARQLTKRGPLGKVLLAKEHTEALDEFGIKLTKEMEAFMAKSVANIETAGRIREDERLMERLAEGVERDSSFNTKPVFPTELSDMVLPAALMDTIIQWAQDTDPAQGRVLWLLGSAGRGKTAIAKALAKRFKDENTPRGIFMFSDVDGVTKAGKVAPTLAYQLASDLPGFKAHLLKAIRGSETSINAEIPSQFDHLLVEPLSHLHSPQPHTVLILDGIEDCPLSSLIAVLVILSDLTEQFPFIRILITSRPDTRARYQVQDSVQELSIPAANEDVEAYIRANLTKAYRRFHPEARSWPDDERLASLVTRAGSLFIYAATAVRFISDQGEQEGQLERRLDALLSDDDIDQQVDDGKNLSQLWTFDSLFMPTFGADIVSERSSTLGRLDRLYRTIVKDAMLNGRADFDTRFQTVVGTVVFSLARPLSVDSLTEFLGPDYDADEVRVTLRVLNSVIFLPPQNDMAGLRVYHKTFADFISDADRCTVEKAFLRPTTHHARLYSRHLYLLKEAIQNDPSDGETIQLRITAATQRLQLCLQHLSAFKSHIVKGDPATDEIERIKAEARAVSGLLTSYDIRTKYLRIPGKNQKRYFNPSQDPHSFGYSRSAWEDLIGALSRRAN